MSGNPDADLIAFDMPFAKVVDTGQGEALLIGGRVYTVTGPGGNCADVFSRALRSMSRSDGSPFVATAGHCADLSGGIIGSDA